MDQEVNLTEEELATEAEGAEAPAPSAEAVLSEDVMAALAKELDARTTERDTAQDQLLRMRAEFDNYRKRTAREVERLRKTATQSLVCELLPVLDNLERAIKHGGDTTGNLERGVELVLGQMQSVLARTGLEAIPALGQPFDPNVHEALSHLPSEEHPADSVMEEFSKGYRLGGCVVRPAKVVVSSGPPDVTAAASPVEQIN